MRHCFLLAATACLLLTGCLGSRLPPETDATKGREALTTVLDAWSKGKTPEDLKAASPSIIAYDPDWAAGQKLAKYEIAPGDKRYGVDLLLKATLTLGGASGPTRDKKVNFTVAIGSSTVVLRTQ
jgi:hypothetical protein